MLKSGSSKSVNRLDLIQVMRRYLAISGRHASDILESFIDTISETLEAGGQVKVANFGRFQTKESPKRPGRNPKTGEAVEIPARRRVCFTMSRSLRLSMAKRWEQKKALKGDEGANAWPEETARDLGEKRSSAKADKS